MTRQRIQTDGIADGAVTAAKLAAGAVADEILEYTDETSFPATGSTNKIYVATDSGRTYQWVGTAYAEVGAGATTTASHTHIVSEVTGAATLPATGLTITKSGDFFASPGNNARPFQFFNIVPAQALQFDNTYVRYSGLWINGWDYNEVNWATPQPRLTSLTLDNLEGTTGSLAVTNTGAITALSFPALRYSAALTITNHSALTVLSFPLLYANGSYTAGGLSITGNNALTTVEFPSLVYALATNGAFSNVSIGGNAITTVSFPALKVVANGGLNINGCGLLTSLSVPSLQYVSGGSVNGISLTNLTSLSSVAFPSLVAVAANASAFSATGCTVLTSITLPTDGTLKHIGGSFTVTGNALTTAAVDHLLARLVALDGNGGTILYGSGRVANISGVNTAAPSNAGFVNVTLATSPTLPNLVCSGTTCTVNMTAHGYIVGDVLRVSGVTGATNANRYAVVASVPSANQFTYTTVNTASPTNGAGTMNIVKANNDVKTLITRGVSLTTN